ncbi:beta-1,6-N-acetylglucosaminyltransferase [Nostoc sp. TCL26-01]|uniref:beta-1,6-N-acetylglucosaminyltransferase n=1 Tax=Nostoc sp. TCL26-01 TaxID=2576904 RepID=UPI0015B92A00|nr:beta-1,6-N-acetylglucosaminyltransferase [Nostoc sp. TCL26-01]QLE58466.1 hypothetical protein FD725_24920 [Nostoc sp. TCL26-01]
MKIAYIILAHKLPAQVVRLVQRLKNDDTSFFIHIDSRASNEMCDHITKELQGINNIYYIERHRCYWGDFSLVAATIAAIKQLVNSDVEFDYAILLSGQDYLIKTNQQIQQFLQERRGQEFIEYFSLKSDNRWTNQDGCYQSLNRIQHWHLNFRFKGLHLHLPIQRRFPVNFEPFGGSQWWCLSKECIHYINSFITNKPQYVNYFQYVFIPDEVFFQTIIANSPFRQNVVNDDLRFIDWEHHNPTPPAVLDKGYFAQLVNSPQLFARKFDITRDANILDLIDQHLERCASELSLSCVE